MSTPKPNDIVLVHGERHVVLETETDDWGTRIVHTMPEAERIARMTLIGPDFTHTVWEHQQQARDEAPDER